MHKMPRQILARAGSFHCPNKENSREKGACSYGRCSNCNHLPFIQIGYCNVHGIRDSELQAPAFDEYLMFHEFGKNKEVSWKTRKDPAKSSWSIFP